MAEEAEQYPRLVSEWPSGEAFMLQFEEDGPGSFFHPVAADRELPPRARLGTLMSVTLRFADHEYDFHIHARVVERITEGDQRGIRFEFLTEEETRVELVTMVARGDSVPLFRRKYPRYPCNLRVKVQLGRGSKLEATAYTIGEGGIGLAIDETTFEENSIIDLTIPKPGSRQRVRVQGRVRGIVAAGPQQGVGVEFLLETPSIRDQVAELVAVVRAQPL